MNLFNVRLRGRGIAAGRPANLVVPDADSDYEAVRQQAKATLLIRHGKVILPREPERVAYPE
ncbi:cytosine deaminase [Burkholderia lata]|uniref:Cytosine deaminase n=1 Tax=Burkholderia lata (strain ATCC 17760 / DSM 23089 / LMG 22485 / NCIMB 9086 / R18194 / 383) TaxID=482957 RepID=A0A6P2XPM5_BURL3|nr:cytosine deaminase [Burkholderia lata]